MTLHDEVGQQAREFRDQLRQWLEAHRPEQEFAVDLEQAIFGNVPDIEQWAAKVHEAGYMCISWPREFGGSGLSEVEVAVMSEEFVRAGLPRPTRGLGETLVGPSILAWGTDEQKARFLPRIVDGTERYCQGFSEPDAGSDLASLKTTGTMDGDEIVLNGQKVWTSGAGGANMLFCLCRTDSAVAAHKGISFVILPVMREDGSSNGIDIRLVRQPTGSAEFAETFLTDARAPLGNVVGGVNNGWQVCMTTLAAERRGSATTQHVPFVEQFWDVVRMVQSRGTASDSRVRQELARAFIEIELIRYRGIQQLGDVASDNGESPIGTMSKIGWSEHARQFSQAIMNLRGPMGMIMPDHGRYEPDQMTANFLFSPGLTIAGGTSEILRNVLAERILGLPREER